MTFWRLVIGYLIQVVPFAFLAFYPFKENLRFSRRKLLAMSGVFLTGFAVVFAGTGCCLQRLLPPDSDIFAVANAVFMLTLVPCALFLFWNVNARWHRKLLVFTFCATSAGVITSIENVISTAMLDLSWSGSQMIPYNRDLDGLPYQGWSLPVLIVMTAVLLPFLLRLIDYAHRSAEDALSPKADIYLSLFSLLLCLVLGYGLSALTRDSLNDFFSLFMFITLHISIFVIYGIIFRVIRLTYEKNAVQKEADQARYALSLQTEQYRRISESIESSRRMRHDLRHHMVALHGFLQSSDLEEAQKYVEGYLEHSKRQEWISLCGNNVVNIVVCHYRALAAERNIRFTVHISVPEKLGISDEDISVLTGNLLENAIEAAERAKEEYRYIYLNISCSGKMMVIVVDNGFNGNVNMNGGDYFSTKAQHRGIGMQSIQRIIEKYDGSSEFSHEDTVFHFSGMLRMRL